MTQDNEASAARAVIEEYVAACNEGNVGRLRAIFHEQAMMSGYMMGNAYQDHQNLFSGRKEAGFMRMNFTDYFHLAQIDGDWKIISKTFNPEP